LKRFLFFLFLSSLFFSAHRLHSQGFFNVFRHSETVSKNSIFFDLGIAPLVFDDPQFNVIPLDLRIEYFPPLPLPVAIGIFMKTPDPNLKSFGLRASYHFNLLDTDLYIAYSFDFGWLRNDLLAEYNDTPVDELYYDFRLGVRRFFGSRFGISVETGFHFESIIFMLSLKIN